MTGMNWEELTPAERLMAEQAVLHFRELDTACDAAADGRVLEVCETLALRQGRESIRRAIAAALGRQAEPVEKKGRRAGPAAADARDATADASPAR